MLRISMGNGHLISFFFFLQSFIHHRQQIELVRFIPPQKLLNDVPDERLQYPVTP